MGETAHTFAQRALGSGLNWRPPSYSGGDHSGGEEVVGSFVIARGDATEVFEPTEHSFDEVAAAVGLGVPGIGMFACRVGRDHRFDPSSGEPVPQFASVVGAVGQQPSRDGGAPQHLGGSDQVVGVACRDDQGAWPAELVSQGVDLGRAAAARRSDGVGEGPPFAPAAERCALT